MEKKYGMIIIDTWNGYQPMHNFMTDLIEHYICNIAFLLDHTNIPIALSCYNGGDFATGPHHMLAHRCVHSKRIPQTNRLVTTSIDNVTNLFKENEVNTICYAGFSFPGCIEDRPLGILSMNNRFECEVIADCTLNLYSSHKNHFDRINEMYRHIKKNEYEYVFSADLISELSQISG